MDTNADNEHAITLLHRARLRQILHAHEQTCGCEGMHEPLKEQEQAVAFQTGGWTVFEFPFNVAYAYHRGAEIVSELRDSWTTVYSATGTVRYLEQNRGGRFNGYVPSISKAVTDWGIGDSARWN